ncbi:hypothetical protein Btru_040114 [Bulinus truncatus]|nr:hypothetical protein Btru_040114 [Bulinus truncatus]
MTFGMKLFIIWAGVCCVKSKDKPTLTLVDMSESLWCTSDRLLPTYDEILLMIHVAGGQTDAVSVTLRSMSDSKKRKPKQICLIEFISGPCEADQQIVCYCASSEDGWYTLYVTLPAQTLLSEAEVKAQGVTSGRPNQLTSTVTLPVIADFLSVTLSVNNESMEIFPIPEITVKQNTTHWITVCPKSAGKTAMARWEWENESVAISQCVDMPLDMVEEVHSLFLTDLVTCGLNDSLRVDFFGVLLYQA